MFKVSTRDDRVLSPTGEVLIGGFYYKYQNGGDRPNLVAGMDLHDYYCRVQSSFSGYIRRENHITLEVNDLPLDAYSQNAEWDANDDLALINKLSEKTNQTALNGGNFLGELPQTVSMLAGGVESLAKGLKKALAKPKSGAPSRRCRHPLNAYGLPKPGCGKKTPDSFIGDDVLAFNFGVRPLIDDVWELAQIVHAGQFWRTRVRARRAGREGKWISMNEQLQETTGYTKLSKQYIYYIQNSPPTFYEQFGLADPATIAWELLPWSFVVDWVLPIGNFIAAQSFALRLNGVIVTTTREKIHWESSLRVANPSENVSYSEGARSSFSSTTISRGVNTSLSVPLPTMKSNLLGGKPLERLANALSLIGQR